MFIRNAPVHRAPPPPSTPRLDLDRVVGIACLLMFPVAFWLV